MQHLVGSGLTVAGPGPLDQVLPVPPPRSPNRFAGMNAAHQAQRDAWYRDVAVLAFPTPAAEVTKIDEVDLKTLKDVRPYSIRHAMTGGVAPFVRSQAEYRESDVAHVLDANRMIDLTQLLAAKGV